MAKFYSLFSGSKGNVSIVRSGKQSLLIDAGMSCKQVISAMSARDIPECSVSGILITHTHSDHIGNIPFYPNARVYVHKGGKTEIPGARIIESDDFKLTEGVRLVYTPGHCTEEMSVFVDADRHYVCAGDAIPLEGNFTRNLPPTLNTDRRLALESIKKIREYADVVIPGHDFPFVTER